MAKPLLASFALAITLVSGAAIAQTSSTITTTDATAANYPADHEIGQPRTAIGNPTDSGAGQVHAQPDVKDTAAAGQMAE